MKSSQNFNSQRIISSIGLLGCCGLLILATPRLVASLYALYPETVLQETNKSFSTEIYGKCINDLNKSLAWQNNSTYLTMLSSFYVKIHNATPATKFDLREDLLHKAHTALTQSLAINPIAPYEWLQLAELDSQLFNPKQVIINSIRMSFYTGRVEPDLTISRIRFSYLYFNDFDDEMKNLFQRQIVIAWNLTPTDLITFLKATEPARDMALIALSNMPEQLKLLRKSLNLSIN